GLRGPDRLRPEDWDCEQFFHREIDLHGETLHEDLSVRVVLLPQLDLLQVGEEEEGHEHGDLVPDVSDRQGAERDRLAVELGEALPGEAMASVRASPCPFWAEFGANLRVAFPRRAVNCNWIFGSR